MSSTQKQKGISEVDAVKALDDALGALDAETRQRVLGWAFAKFAGQVPTPAPGVPGGPHVQPVPGAPSTVKAFLAAKKPDGFYERVACLVYFLEKNDKKEDITTREITKANTDARLSAMSNTAVFVKHATDTYGFLSRLSRGKVGISSRGEAVVDALPDRAKVEQALTDHPIRKKGAKGKRKAGK